MKMNPAKSQFLCVNSPCTQPFDLGEVVISHTDRYTYLGTSICIGSISEQVKMHLKSKSGHVLKFLSFLRKNSDAPYKVKKKVWESALRSSIFYGCETWYARDLKAAESVYSSTIKSMLAVRQTTCNDIVFL